jgi:hypothetical protein
VEECQKARFIEQPVQHRSKDDSKLLAQKINKKYTSKPVS